MLDQKFYLLKKPPIFAPDFAFFARKQFPGKNRSVRIVQKNGEIFGR